jgi:hypothetical protein
MLTGPYRNPGSLFSAIGALVSLPASPKQSPHYHRGQHSRNRGGAPLENRFQDVVLYAPALGHPYEPLGHQTAKSEVYPRRQRGHHSLLSLVVHASLLLSSLSPTYISTRRRLETRINTGTLEYPVLAPASAAAAFVRRTVQNATRSYRAHASAWPGSARQDPTVTLRDKSWAYC